MGYFPWLCSITRGYLQKPLVKCPAVFGRWKTKAEQFTGAEVLWVLELSQVPCLKFSPKHVELLGSFGYGQNEVYLKTTSVLDAFSRQSVEVTGGPARNLAFYLDWRSRTLKAIKKMGPLSSEWCYGDMLMPMFTGFAVGWNVARNLGENDGFSAMMFPLPAAATPKKKQVTPIKRPVSWPKYVPMNARQAWCIMYWY